MSTHNGRRMPDFGPGDESDHLADALDLADIQAQDHAAAQREALDVVMDEDDAARRLYREAALRAQNHYRNLFVNIQEYQGERGREFALECAIAAQGWWELLPVKNFVQLAARWHCTKANVEKLVGELQRETGLPPTLSQRDPAGCANMARRRKEQLTKP